MTAKKFFLNTLFFSFLAYAFYLKAPQVMDHFKFQDQVAPDFTVQTLNGENFNLHSQVKNVVVVFWATWCGPCEVELKRINKMIMDRKILPSDVLAIASHEDAMVVKESVAKKNYLFNVAIDRQGAVSQKFLVKATPTIVFIDKDHIINWMTTGVSPTLEFRLSSFLK